MSNIASRTCAALVCAALWVLPVASCQSDGPPPPNCMRDVEVAPPPPIRVAIEPRETVERELVARAIALGEVDVAEVDALLGHADWTLCHLALDALGRTSVSRSRESHHAGNLIVRALRDPFVELRVAALRATRLDGLGVGAEALRAADDPAPEVRLAAVRELASVVDPSEWWCRLDGELPAQLFRREDDAAELARRMAWTAGPSLESTWRVPPMPTGPIDWKWGTWLEMQHRGALAPGAWAALARDHAARTGGDPWGTVVTCFEECLAHRDWRRGPLAHILRDLAATPSQRAIALALLAHVRELTEDEATTLVGGIPTLCAEFGTEDAGRVLLPAARLASPVLARALARSLPDSIGEARELVARCAAAAVEPQVLGAPEPDVAAAASRALASAQSAPVLHGVWHMLLDEAARHAARTQGATGVFTRPLARAREDLRAALQGDPTVRVELRYGAELAIGEALAREGRLGAALKPKDVAVPELSAAGSAGVPTPVWWEADADFLAALARRAAPHEPAAAARLAEAALVAHMGLLPATTQRGLLSDPGVAGSASAESPREREWRVTRTELLALWLAVETAAGERPGAARESMSETRARMGHFERASRIASELVAGMALTNLERGFATRDSRGLDLPTLERLFGTPDSQRVDPRAQLSAAVDQLALHALLGFLARGNVTTTGGIWPQEYAGPFGRADWIARSGAARALEERIATRYGDRYTFVNGAYEPEQEGSPSQAPGRR